jgi:hypothetical protein
MAWIMQRALGRFTDADKPAKGSTNSYVTMPCHSSVQLG